MYGLPRTKVLAHHVRPVWFIVKSLVWDSDKAGVLVADEVGVGKTFTSAVQETIQKLLTEIVVIGLALLMLCGNTHE
jgi:hypothetical protein